MGYRDRDFMVAPERWPLIMPGGGVLRPAIVAGGAAIGTWRSQRKGKTIRVQLEPFAGLDRETADAIEAEVAEIGRFENSPAAIEPLRR